MGKGVRLCGDRAEIGVTEIRRSRRSAEIERRSGSEIGVSRDRDRGQDRDREGSRSRRIRSRRIEIGVRVTIPIKAKGIEVIVYEPVLTEAEFYRSRVVNDLEAFKREADEIIGDTH